MMRNERGKPGKMESADGERKREGKLAPREGGRERTEMSVDDADSDMEGSVVIKLCARRATQRVNLRFHFFHSHFYHFFGLFLILVV